MFQTIKDIYAILYWNFVAKNKPSRLKKKSNSKEINIIYTGPSAREYLEYLSTVPRDKNAEYMFINEMSTRWRELFYKLKPEYYMVLDQYFEADRAPQKWVEAMEAVDWHMILIVNPMNKNGLKNPNIELYNLAPIEIMRTNPIIERLHMSNYCSISFNNVSISAVMEAVRRGFKKIFLYGLDYDYILNISVDINNHLYMNNVKHSDDEKEKEEGKILLHDAYPRIIDMWNDIIGNFKSFYIIEEYARKRGIRIINMNPNSLVDAFEKSSDIVIK